MRFGPKEKADSQIDFTQRCFFYDISREVYQTNVCPGGRFSLWCDAKEIIFWLVYYTFVCVFVNSVSDLVEDGF